MDSSFCYKKIIPNHHKLEGIKEDFLTDESWQPEIVRCSKVLLPPPETPTESMEFLARSWSLSSMEISRALTKDITTTSTNHTLLQPNLLDQTGPVSSTGVTVHDIQSTPSLLTAYGNDNSAVESMYKSIQRGKMVGRWLKDQKEKKKQETRAQNAQLYAAISVAGVAAVVAAIAAATAMSYETSPALLAGSKDEGCLKTSAAVASAAALVASHCVEVAADMGADHDQIAMAIKSAVNIKTNGDIMALTAGAATALRGAATLRARLRGDQNAAFASKKEQVEGDMLPALNFVYKGGELLKRTRKGGLHWKQVSFYINTDKQVIVKMKSKYMVGTFTKKKKCVVSDVEYEIFSWPGRERDEGGEQRSYFGVKTYDRLIEFECRSKGEKQLWIDGITKMLHCNLNFKGQNTEE